VLEGLAYLHSKGWAHTGLKPSNILSVDEQLKISRSGLRRMGEARDARWNAGNYDAPGTPGRRISTAGDVWSLGVVLVEVLTQRLPSWEGKAKDIALPEALPPPFQQIAAHCLQPDPEDRWTVAEITTSLQYGLTVAAGASAAPAQAVSPGWWKHAMLWQAQCPDCSSRDLTRSRRRNALEKTLSGVLLPYRCGRCGARFYRLRVAAG
jgi:serine/threonine protein kinase